MRTHPTTTVDSRITTKTTIKNNINNNITAFPFGALPVLEVDGVQIGQTLSIVRYVAREFGKHIFSSGKS